MREYKLTSVRPFKVNGNEYNGITMLYKRCIRPKVECPKTYKKVGGFKCNERGTYESGLVTIYKTRNGYAASLYKDGCFNPYYAKCVLN